MGSDDKFEKIEDNSENFVPVVFAQSTEEAKRFQELLSDHDIPALVGTEEEDAPADVTAKPVNSSLQGASSHSLPVLVPKAMLDEASDIIVNREDSSQFDTDDDLDIEDSDDDSTIVEGLDIGTKDEFNDSRLYDLDDDDT